MKTYLSWEDLYTVGPAAIVFFTGLLLVFLDLFAKKPKLPLQAILGTLALITAFFATLWQQKNQVLDGFGGEVSADLFSTAFTFVFLLLALLALPLTNRNLAQRKLGLSEVHPLLLFAVGGMILMVQAKDLLVLFIGLEIVSISSYILCGAAQSDPRSNESAMKYFLLGAFATGILLYGIALLYGATGSIRLQEMGARLGNAQYYGNPLAWLGMGLLFIGFGFKLAFVPFHMWTPDVYEGAPTSVAMFLSAGPKAAGFAALVRILFEALEPLRDGWVLTFWVLAVLTMTVGNVLALQQNNVKRMLAYSSIAHAGYMLAGLVPANAAGVAGIWFYSLVYVFMNAGAFTILLLASDTQKERLEFNDYAGLGFERPWIGALTVLFMLSLAGIPLTGGFIGKFQIFKAVIDEGYISLAVIGMLNSVISLYYYLRLVVVMYMQPRERSAPTIEGFPVLAVFVFCALAVLYLGLAPAALLDYALQAAMQLVALG